MDDKYKFLVVLMSAIFNKLEKPKYTKVEKSLEILFFYDAHY